MADTALVISSTRVSPLSVDETGAYGYTDKYTVLYSDIAYGTGSTDTVTLTLGSTSANWYVDKATAFVQTAFAGTTALTVAVGTSTTTNAFITAQSVLVGGTTINGATGLPVLTNATATAAKNLVAVFTNATGGSPSALTAGALNIYLRVVDSTRLP